MILRRALATSRRLQTMTQSHILRPGSLAYFDTFAGLIPCKVTRIEGVQP